MAYNKGKFTTGVAHTGEYQKKKWNGYTKAPPVIRGCEYRPILNPSSQQKNIFDHIANSSSSLVVDAKAGTGKTTTAAEAMVKYIPRDKSVFYTVFANRNAREAEAKTPEYIKVSTVHSLGLAALKNAFGSKVEVDAKEEKARAIATALLGPEDEKTEARYHFVRALGLAKGYLCDDNAELVNIFDKHGVETGDYSATEFADIVLEGMQVSQKQYMRIDFNDMIWLPVKLNLAVQQYDVVVPDEMQDLSPARIELAIRAVKPGGRLFGIGDPFQSIFGFTGAQEDAMDVIRVRMNADVLPLSQTFRCGKKIVEYANQYVADYSAADTNVEGEVEKKTHDKMLQEASSGDFIISRVNADLVKICLQFIRDGRKATVLGKDLGKALSYMVKRSNAKNVIDFLSFAESWKNVECEKLASRNKPCDHIVDKFDTLVALSEGTNSIEEMKTRIETMFSDENEKNIITLSTAHKSKGLERDRVFLLAHTFARMKPKNEYEVKQEKNIAYVAATRARHSLFLVNP